MRPAQLAGCCRALVSLQRIFAMSKNCFWQQWWLPCEGEQHSRGHLARGRTEFLAGGGEEMRSSNTFVLLDHLIYKQGKYQRATRIDSRPSASRPELPFRPLGVWAVPCFSSVRWGSALIVSCLQHSLMLLFSQFNVFRWERFAKP